MWCTSAPPPRPPPPTPQPPVPSSPPKDWCNNDRSKGNDCAVGLTCGGRPPFVSKRKTNDFCNTYYSPKANSGKVGRCRLTLSNPS